MRDNFNIANRQLAIFKMLANANRIKIIKVLMSAESSRLSVMQIALETKLSVKLVSDHLKLLRLNKIVAAKQDGSFMLYRLSEPVVMKMLNEKL